MGSRSRGFKTAALIDCHIYHDGTLLQLPEHVSRDQRAQKRRYEDGANDQVGVVRVSLDGFGSE